MGFHRARFQASQPADWPAIQGITASLLYLGAWAYIDSSSITISRVVILIAVGIALAQLGRIRLSESLLFFGLFMVVLGFIVGSVYLKIDGATDPLEAWKVFGPWFLPELFFAIFSTRILNFINYVAHALVLPGIYLAMPVTTVLSERWPQSHRRSGSETYYSAPVRRDVARTAGASGGRGAIAAGVASGVAVGAGAGAANIVGDVFGQSIEQGFVYEEPTVNPMSGLHTIGGAGSPDIAGNSWCTVDNWCPDVYYEVPFDGGGCGFSDF